MSVDEAAPVQQDNQPSKKKISLQDCKSHNKEEDCWLVISGKVYDVTEFLDEHPGGFDIVLAATGNKHYACQIVTLDLYSIKYKSCSQGVLNTQYICSGKDATEDFEEIGHSNAAREMLDRYYVGEFEVRMAYLFFAQASPFVPQRYVLYLQGGEQAANQANSTAHASAKQAQAKHSNSSLQGILPFLPIIFVLLAVLVGYQFLGKQ